MLKKTAEFYDTLMKEYVEKFENEAYTFYVAYKKCDRIPDVVTPEIVELQFAPKNDTMPNISVLNIIKKDEPHQRQDINIFKVFEKSIDFADMHGTTGEWAIAAETIVDANRLIEERIPGYCITQKTDW